MPQTNGSVRASLRISRSANYIVPRLVWARQQLIMEYMIFLIRGRQIAPSDPAVTQPIDIAWPGDFSATFC